MTKQDTITIIRKWCSACDAFTWHVQTITGSWVCLQCRSQDLEDALEESFIILAT